MGARKAELTSATACRARTFISSSDLTRYSGYVRDGRRGTGVRERKSRPDGTKQPSKIEEGRPTDWGFTFTLGGRVEQLTPPFLQVAAFLLHSCVFVNRATLQRIFKSPIKVLPFANGRARPIPEAFAGMLKLLWECKLGH